MELNKLYLGDCLEIMPSIADNSIDMVFCDLPYGVTNCAWDSVIPFDLLWQQYKRIVKPNGAIVLTASQPFTAALVMSNPKMFRCEWIWEKSTISGFLNAKKRPLVAHEQILIFASKAPRYYPQMTQGDPYKHGGSKTFSEDYNPHNKVITINDGERYPRSVINFSNPNGNKLHPTQKPVELIEYFIETYSKEGETVLDNCIGSGTTAIACINKGRNWIGIEKETKYFQIASDRIERHLEKMSIKQPKLF